MMNNRVLSGMRPTGEIHLGHLCGVIANWRKMQDESECFFFVADWHALTTDYAAPGNSPANADEMITSWLAAGIDAQRATLFIQSQIPEHAELHLLLSMICPLAKLMQLPTYKEQKENLNRDLDTYGFLGYPLLQSADILAYKPSQVPVGEDQLPHIEFTREIARRFNHLYGGGEGFVKQVKETLRALPAEARKTIERAYQAYRQDGEESALTLALAEIEQLGLSTKTQAVLRGYCAYDAEEILPLPDACLTPAAKLLGTDGRKMSKSYNNTIALSDEPSVIFKKIARMQTDPARKLRTDPGEPKNCPVWSLHEHFSEPATHQWVKKGCRSAGIGCVECKKKLADNINTVLQPIQQRRDEIERNGIVKDIIAAGNQRAQAVARETLQEVRHAMRLTVSV
ncbi:MAG: tryptophan--tRNA ligase [Proteobacteria bacterium]|nr:tryptophan--tRNA ligase [Pseudomonadota bacterium]